MNPSHPPLDILPLLRDVYPALRKDYRDKDKPATGLLLMHCAAVVRERTARGEKMGNKEALAIFKALDQGDGRGDDQSEAESHLRRAVLEACPPWTLRDGEIKGWGWHAMREICDHADGAAMRTLLDAPGAPRGASLTQPRFDLVVKSGLTHIPDTQLHCNAYGLLLCGNVWRDGEPGWRETVDALVAAGADINASMGEGIGPPLAHVHFPQALVHMVQHGANLGRIGEDLPAIAAMFTHCHWPRAIALVEACTQLSQANPQVGEAMRQAWPDILGAWGQGLSNAKERLPEAVRFLQAANRLAQALDLPLGSNRVGQPNLFAYWARALLSHEKDVSHRFHLLGDFPAWPELTGSVPIRHAWAGEIEPGIPDGAWGLMVACLKSTVQKATFPRPQVNAFMADKGDAFWEGYGRLVERMAHTPGAWKSLPVLEPLIPKRMLRGMVRTAMLGYLAREEADEPSPYSSDAGRGLAQMASKWLLRIAKGGEVDEEMCNLALRMHLHRGMKSVAVREAFNEFATHHPERVDSASLGRTLERNAHAFDAAQLAQLRALLLAVHTQEPKAVRPGPRL